VARVSHASVASIFSRFLLIAKKDDRASRDYGLLRRPLRRGEKRLALKTKLKFAFANRVVLLPA